MNKTAKCPMCAEEIPADATVCPFCNTPLVSEPAPVAASSQAPPQIVSPAGKPKRAGLVIGLIVAGFALLCVIAGVVWVVSQGGIAGFLPETASTPTRTKVPRPTATSTPMIVIVSATQDWVDTGIQVFKDQVLTITASGLVKSWSGQTSGNDPLGQDGICTPAELNADCLLNYATYAALVGRIGDQEPFYIGTYTRIVVPQDGILYLGVNDNIGYHGDNSGSFIANITIH
ncbi:MAG: LecA/PA-IL family lectin [Chloroflexota bacterium]